MFSSAHHCSGYDFSKSENVSRWRGLFTPSLKKVLEQVHPRLSAKEDALLYVETLCMRILSMLCAKPLPHSVQDVEDKVRKSFPSPIDCWALNDAKETISTKRKKSVLPTDRVHTLLQKDVLLYKIDSSVSAFLVAVLEYISADILKLAGNYVRKIKHTEITREDIEVAMCADKVFMDMFCQNDMKTNLLSSPLPTLPVQRTSTTYEEVVKELIHDEKQYQRDLHMIIRVFRDKLINTVKDPKELEPIFSNILDIYEVTVTLLGSLEDVIEMSQEQSIPCVGSCFEELAEAEEFDVYTKYAQEVTSQQSKTALTALLANPDAIKTLNSAGHGFRDAVQFYLPKLLLIPIWHSFLYFDYIKQLIELSHSQEDIESFKQVQGLLTPMQYNLEHIVSSLPKEICYPLSSRARRQQAIERTRELQNSVEHSDKDVVGQSCNEFIREGSLGKLGSGKRIAERKVYLFDGLMVLCKANTKKQAPSAGQPAYDYRLKETFYMRCVAINDRADTEELKNSFEIAPREHPPVILTAKSLEHKNDWMADLIMVNTKSMLDRTLDTILLDIEKKHPLRMPSPDIYKFAVPDSTQNIILEDRESTGVPLIKGATLCKLVERLTYQTYADPMFVRTFLTTYRYFCSPQNLLELLIERFNIPDPSLVYLDHQQGNDKDLHSCDTEKMHKNSQREDWKRYRKEYVQPVQFRVLNVLRHWVDHHFYDFEKDPTLLQNLVHFLENVNGKSMRKWVDSVMKIVQRKKEQETSHKQITFAYGHSPPPIEHHLNVPDSEITLITLHPLELARQLTLLEFELYKNVKPSELVGSPWTKKDKELKSPNLLKIMKHTTNVTRWIEKSIIEAENYEERVAIVARAIEVMMVMLDLNNFNGILSISAAMGSASVYRLKLTFQGLPARYEKFLEECRELNDGHLKKYQERLRSINPPCVPFFGRYLTNILHLEEGNPDFLHNTELINFSKRRKVSEIIGEIQQYQNQPYCLMVEPKIRSFLENLDPFKGLSDTDISNFLYHESLRIEPRGCKQPPKFPRKWASVSLKSPGIKPRRQTNSNTTGSVASLMQFGNKAQQHASGSDTASIAEHSPVASGSSSSSHNHNTHPQAFSVFANVNIPERNGSMWPNNNQQQQQASISTNACTKTEDQFEGNGEISFMTKKLTDTATDKATSPMATDIDYLHRAVGENVRGGGSACIMDLAIEPEASQSPLLKLLSPRHDKHSAKNRSPFQNTLPANKFNSHSVSNNSPNDILSGMDTASPQMTEIDFACTATVPVSPHVNVPTAMNIQYRAAPPPLPPRRKESCAADYAQKRQAPDAPMLPPRDGELSPPPIPPRINHSINAYSRSIRPTTEFMGGNNSLLLPNTSSIMIRRNSAIEKKSAAGSTATSISSSSSSTITTTTTSFATLIGNKPTPLSNVPVSGFLNTATTVSNSDEQTAISPALSSSTTTSPMTPMTPISPHIPQTGYQISDNIHNPSRFKPSSSSMHQHHHHHHQQAQLQQQQQHQKLNANAAMMSGVPQTHASPTEFYSNADSTPKLPPKPSLNRNYKNSDKTMFLYPSTNQE